MFETIAILLYLVIKLASREDLIWFWVYVKLVVNRCSLRLQRRGSPAKF